MGYIYILSHERIPGLVKIGFTETSVQERVASINSATGVPGGFNIEAVFETELPRQVERRVHLALAPFRFSSRKEFFEVPLSYAISLVESTLEEPLIQAELDDDSSANELSIMNLTPKALGQVIKFSRKKQELNQSDLAKMAGCGIRAVVEIEQGKPTAQIGIVLKLISALNIRLFVETE